LKLRNNGQINSVRRGRLIAGLVGLVLSLGYGLQAWTTLPMGTRSQPGAAVFPLIVAVLMTVSSLVILFEDMKSLDSEEGPLGLPSGAGLHRLLGVIASLVGYVVIAYLVGHLIASVLLSLALVHLIKPGSWVRTVVIGLAISLSAYGVFVSMLGVPLPGGVLW
jgi:putative tricarboxylic transport membrane protein